jgi:hypothetical protein
VSCPISASGTTETILTDEPLIGDTEESGVA